SARTIRYALTPEGVAEIARRASGFFRRAARNAELFRGGIEDFVAAKRRDGATTLVLAGQSEVDFLFEYVCEREALVFVKAADPDKAYALGKRAGIVVVYSDDAAGRLGDRALGVDRISSIVGHRSRGPEHVIVGEPQ
ncbi:MAG: hypothetical protein Q8M76_17910, partial [Spirochaetaceae bacterium]|nr:hypothetical protein [Spirochaetaceae bacterium]